MTPAEYLVCVLAPVERACGLLAPSGAGAPADSSADPNEPRVMTAADEGASVIFLDPWSRKV